jgi:hypothetical protein
MARMLRARSITMQPRPVWLRQRGGGAEVTGTNLAAAAALTSALRFKSPVTAAWFSLK